MKRFYCSYFDRNYLVRAIALIDSLNAQEKSDFTFYAVCLDEITRLALDRLALPNVVTVPMHAIEQRDFPLLSTKPTRSQVEYYWTCTPSIILRLIERNPEIDVLTYVDSDMMFFSSPDAIYNELGSDSILIHEHRYCPELAHLAEQGGRFNVGLMQFRRDQTGLEALNWWRERCIEWCYWRFEDGKMGDQRYLHDWPTRFPSVHVLENLGAGLAPWNHTQYKYSLDRSGNVLVDGNPLVFYHYQSLQIVDPRLIIPASHTTYPLTTELISNCFLPYADALANAAAQVRTIMPDFSFGISSTDGLTTDHTFIAKSELTQQLASQNVPHQVMELAGDWVLYKSSQIKDATPLALEGEGQGVRVRGCKNAQPLPGSPLSTLHSQPVPNLWPADRQVTCEDSLLRELMGRPISREIKTAYIVGAHRYQERGLIDAMFPNLEHIYLFEPLPNLYSMLKGLESEDPRIKVFPYAVADRDGQAEFNVTNNDAASSSLLPLGKHREIFPHVGVTQKIPVECRTLDTIVKDHNLAEPDMLFLDVQGAEYGILAAISPERIARMRLIYTEASKEELYLGSRPLDEIIPMLEPHQKFAGFAPLVNGLWNHGNALFVNANDIALLERAPSKSSSPYRVSAIVATYNSERFMRGCLDDLIAQTLYKKGELEIVVVNTGSEQNERQIVEEYKKRYDHITHIYIPERERMYAAWNRGIKGASGKYVTSANTDDRHRVDALERMADTLDSRPDIALVYADVDITTQENATFGNAPIKGRFQWLEFDRRTMFMACYMGPQPMWRKELHDRYGYFEPDFKSAGDYEFWLRMCPTETYLHIPETLGLYLESPNSVEHSNQEAAMRESLTALERHWPKAWGPRPEPGSENARLASLAAAQAAAQAPVPTTDTASLVNQAMAAAAQGNNKSARALLWKAIESDPNCAAAYYNLAALLVKDNHIVEAADQACKSVEIDPSDADAIEVLGKIRTLLKATRPAPKSKGKKSTQQGPSQSDIDSRLKRVNALLANAGASAKPKAPIEKPSLSVCMIVRDEEAFIEDCLKSIKGFADEIIVVDTGSKDRTIDIAKSFGAIIHSFKWNGSFADARNRALKHATSEWILSLDADERLDHSSKALMAQAMASGEFDAYDLRACSYLSDGPTPEVDMANCCRLFRNRPEYRFAGRIHEQIWQSIDDAGGKVGRSEALLHHHGYKPEIRNQRRKQDKYIKLLRKEVEENPNDLYYLYHLGVELSSFGKHDQAITILQQTVNLLPKGHPFGPQAYAHLSESLMVTGKFTEALAAVNRAESIGIAHPQLSHAKGNILRCLERYDEAAKAFETAISLGKQGSWDGDQSTYGYKAEYGLAACLLALGDCQGAAEHAQKALQSRPDNADIRELLEKARKAEPRPEARPAKPARKQTSAPKLSLCMIARDEERFIAQCLDSVKDIVDEIIVVDTGSTDHTPEIARSYGAKLHQFPWNDSYADARNEAIKHATHEWILFMDADEKLDADTAHLIRKAIDSSRADGYSLLFRNIMTDGPSPEVTVHHVCRLFKNKPEYRYESRIHEHVEGAILRSGGIVKEIDAIVYHYGYNSDIVASRGKHERYVRMLTAEVNEHPNELFYLHHLAASLCAGREYAKALPYLKRACELVTPTHGFAGIVYSHMLEALRETGQYNEALEWAQRAQRAGIKYPQLAFSKANVLLRCNRPAEAIEAFNEAISLGRGKSWTGDSGAAGYKADYGLASAHFDLGNHAEAIDFAQQVLAQKPDHVASLELLTRAYEAVGNIPMQEKYLIELSRRLAGDPKPIIILAELYESQNRHAQAFERYTSLIDMGSETAALRVKLGNLAEALGQPQQAEQHYLRAIALSGSVPETHNALGQLRVAQERYQEALDCFATAIEVKPEHADSYFSAGDVLYATGNYSQAADFYQAGLSHNSKHAAAFLRLGNCYFQTGVPEAAAIAYRQALAIDPNFADAANNLAMAQEMLATAVQAA